MINRFYITYLYYVWIPADDIMRKMNTNVIKRIEKKRQQHVGTHWIQNRIEKSADDSRAYDALTTGRQLLHGLAALLTATGGTLGQRSRVQKSRGKRPKSLLTQAAERDLERKRSDLQRGANFAFSPTHLVTQSVRLRLSWLTQLLAKAEVWGTTPKEKKRKKRKYARRHTWTHMLCVHYLTWKAVVSCVDVHKVVLTSLVIISEKGK